MIRTARPEELKKAIAGAIAAYNTDFHATEAASRMVMIACDLVSLFRQSILKDEIHARLSTIGFKCFAIGRWVKKSERKKVLKLPV